MKNTIQSGLSTTSLFTIVFSQVPRPKVTLPKVTLPKVTLSKAVKQVWETSLAATVKISLLLFLFIGLTCQGSPVLANTLDHINPTTQTITPVERSSLERAETPPDIQRILDRGKLIVALLKTDNPPFFETPSGSDQPSGLDVEIARELAKTLGVELEFNRSGETFNDVVSQVYHLKADIAISKLSRNLSRAKRVRFSHPYVTMRQGLLINRLQLAQQAQGKQLIEAIRNFNGDVGVIAGSSYVLFLQQKFPDANIKEYPAWEDVVEAVAQGEIQMAYRDELEVKKEILKNPENALTLQTIALTDTKDQIAMAFPWDSEHLQAFVNQYLEMFDIDYTADTVLSKYANY